MTDLQTIVDALAAELRRPVGIDDRHFRSLAYSSHVEELDQVRLSSILQREAPLAVTEFLTSLGIDQADDYRRIAANPSLGMVARVCLPMRFADTLLGYMWLFDEPTPLSDTQLALARQSTDQAAAELFRQRRLESADLNQERELLGRLIGLRPGDPAEAAEALTASGRIAASVHLHVIVLQATSAAGGAVEDMMRVRLAAAADRLRRSVAPNHVLALSTGDAVVAVLAVDSADGLKQKSDLLLEFARETLHDAPHWSPLISISAAYTSLARMASAYGEARAAITVAEVEPSLRPIARWDDLGAFRTIVALLGTSDPAAFIPPSIARLVETDDDLSLVSTLAAWLDNGGDAKHTAETLYLHRSSLYNRLHRIEAIAGLDLKSGEARLELHLGLRLWQLAGGTREIRPATVP